jgi:hypothetical protein
MKKYNKEKNLAENRILRKRRKKKWWYAKNGKQIEET